MRIIPYVLTLGIVAASVEAGNLALASIGPTPTPAISSNKADDIWGAQHGGGGDRWAAGLRNLMPFQEYEARPRIMDFTKGLVGNAISDSEQRLFFLQYRSPQNRLRCGVIRCRPCVGVLSAKVFCRWVTFAEIFSNQFRIREVAVGGDWYNVEEQGNLYFCCRRMPNISMPNGDFGWTTNAWNLGHKGGLRSNPRPIVRFGNISYPIGCISSVMQCAICRRKNAYRKRRLNRQNKSKNSKPRVGFWRLLHQLGKAAAPAWLLTAVISLILGGGVLIIYGDVIGLCIGIALVAVGWLSFAIGWPYAWNLSRSVIDGHC